MPSLRLLAKLAEEHGTPLFVLDHRELRRNFSDFRKLLPRVQPYYAVKANPDPDIVRAFYRMGASFDVASWPEFKLVFRHIRSLSETEQLEYVWNKIIYAHPVKSKETLEKLDRYKPLVVYDNAAEVRKIRDCAPHAGLVLRIKVANTGSMVELASKFGAMPAEAVTLMDEAREAGLTVEGLSFHVGSQCTNFDNYLQALQQSAEVFREAAAAGFDLKLLDIGGGFPAPYDEHVESFRSLARKLNAELDRLFPPPVEILAEPGRFLVATAGTIVARVIGKAVRDGKKCYYIDDGVYGTYSGALFDHCRYPVRAFKRGATEICAVFGPTCDALDTIGFAEELPDLEVDDLVYSVRIGAYSHATSTRFNGFEPAKVVHIHAD